MAQSPTCTASELPIFLAATRFFLPSTRITARFGGTHPHPHLASYSVGSPGELHLDAVGLMTT